MECFPTLGSGPFWDHLKCILGRGRLRSRQYLMGAVLMNKKYSGFKGVIKVLYAIKLHSDS